MKWWLVAAVLAAASPAQEPGPQTLRDTRWRVRNDAAAFLAAAEGREVAAVISAMRPRPDEPGAMVGLGGMPFPRGTEPRLRIDGDVRLETNPMSSVEPLSLPRDAADLVVPWSPEQLGAWVLQERARRRVAAGPGATAVAVPVENAGLAHAWIVLHEPTPEQVLDALGDAERSRFVVAALGALGEQGRDVLRRALADPRAAVRRAAASIEPVSCVDGTQERMGVAALFVERDVEQHAGRMLLRIEPPPVAELLAQLAGAAGRGPARRVAGMLGRIAAGSPEAAVWLLDAAGAEDRVLAERALWALGEPGVLPPDLRVRAAQRLWRLRDALDDVDRKLLWFDALARCAEGVSAAMRDALVEELEAAGPPTGARLLGCLFALGALPELSVRRKTQLARMGHPSTDTLLALADEGVQASRFVLARLTQPPQGIDAGAVAARFATKAPDAMLALLREPAGPDRRARLLRGLAAAGASDRVATEELVAWVDADEPLASAARELLGARLEASSVSSRLELLASPLARGAAWRCLGDGEPDARRDACRRWLDAAIAADDPAVGPLCAELVAMGLEHAADVERLRSLLVGSRRAEALRALARGKSLPVALVEEVQAEFDRGDGEGARLARAALLAR